MQQYIDEDKEYREFIATQVDEIRSETRRIVLGKNKQLVALIDREIFLFTCRYNKKLYQSEAESSR